MRRIYVFYLIAVFFIFPTVGFSEVIVNNTGNSDDSWYLQTWRYIKGTTPNNAIGLLMYSLHLKIDGNFDDGFLQKSNNWNHKLVAFRYDGLAFGTLVNSFYNRSYFVAIDRNVYQKDLGNGFQLYVGYRIGLVSGYDHDTTKAYEKFARHMAGLIPFPQIYLESYYHNFGIVLAETTVALTASFSYKFNK